MQNIAILDSGHNVQSNEFLIKSLVRNGFNVVYNNCDYKELVSLSNTTHIDVFIFGDSYIPDDTIYSFTYLMSNLKSEIWIISTGNSDVGNLQKFLNKRTNAIIEKNNIKEMLIAIDNCCSGRKYFSPIFSYQYIFDG